MDTDAALSRMPQWGVAPSRRALAAAHGGPADPRPAHAALVAPRPPR